MQQQRRDQQLQPEPRRDDASGDAAPKAAERPGECGEPAKAEAGLQLQRGHSAAFSGGSSGMSSARIASPRAAILPALVSISRMSCAIAA